MREATKHTFAIFRIKILHETLNNVVDQSQPAQRHDRFFFVSLDVELFLQMQTFTKLGNECIYLEKNCAQIILLRLSSRYTQMWRALFMLRVVKQRKSFDC